jgi:hypothetical protein
VVDAGRRGIVVGCVLVEFGDVDRRIDFGIGGCSVDDGGRRWERNVGDAHDPCNVGGERRAVDDVLPRRGAGWSGT